ncbi:MAG: KEOPS complex subunit Pcc1 [Haloarculaceae archaeon]
MRCATLRTTHGEAVTAERIAAALRPDNTAEMETSVADDAVVTTVERDSTGGLQATVDDYVVNLQVAAQLASQDGAPSTASPTAADADTGNADTADATDDDTQ